jgi:hypothetical protein
VTYEEVSAVKKQQFWALVDESRKGCMVKGRSTNLKAQNFRYEELLTELPPPELIEFQRLMEERMIEAYRWDVWAAAALIEDGCSASRFEKFRAWLISQGRAAFEAAMKDPDTLADNADCQNGHSQYPAFLWLPNQVYKSKKRHWMPKLGVAHPKQPAGRKLVEDVDEINSGNVEALTRRFPRLAKAFKRDKWYEEDVETAEYQPAPPLKVAVRPMDEDRFWALIEESRRRARRKKPANGDEFLASQMETVPAVLRQLAPEELIAFARRFNGYRRLAYRWDLWGAAYWLHGGCGNDAFLDFRSSLIMLGKELFSQVLSDPDSLAELIKRKDVPKCLAIEGFQYLTSRVYKEKTGYDAMPETPDKDDSPAKPKGRKFDFDDEATMRKHYPRLVAKFPEMGD